MAAQILPYFSAIPVDKSGAIGEGSVMERFVTSFLRFVAGRDDDKASNLHVNRIAIGSSHDRALADFKAEQAKTASHQDGATFVSKRVPK